MNKRIGAIILGFAVVLVLSISCHAMALAAGPFTDVSYIFTMPNELKDRWELRTSDVLSPRKSLFVYFRKAIPDNEGRKIEPAVTMIIENLQQKMDVSLYAGIVSTQLGKHMDGAIEKVEPVNTQKLNALKYKLQYYRGAAKVEHKAFWLLGIFEHQGAYYGLVTVLDSTTSVYPQVESDMQLIMSRIGK